MNSNIRIGKAMARKTGLFHLKGKTVGVRYMSDERKAAEGIAPQVVMGDLYHEGACVFVNYVFGGAVKATRK